MVSLNEDKPHLYRKTYSSKRKIIHGLFNAHNQFCIRSNELCSLNMEGFQIIHQLCKSNILGLQQAERFQKYLVCM